MKSQWQTVCISPPSPTTKKYKISDDTGYLNTLRVFATFAVIMLHVFVLTNACFQGMLTQLETYICVILRNLWQWCVPMFAMISGVLFLNPKKDITIEKILKKYFGRLILAIIIFGIPYSFMEILFESNMSFNIRQIGGAALNTIQGRSWDHMWYLYMLAGLYLCIPMIRIFVFNAPKKVVKFTLAVLFVFTSVIPTLETIIPYKFGIYIPIDSVYVFYFLLGYHIHYNRIMMKNNVLLLSVMLYLVFTVLMPLNDSFVSLSTGGDIILTGYNSPVVVMITFAIFCGFRQKNKALKTAGIIAPMCLGIYLVHMVFINFLYKFIKISPEKYPLPVIVILASLTTIVLSTAFSCLARKIKIVKKYIL
jgi:surface polysaccharide O-acyltransferase-like enzyme